MLDSRHLDMDDFPSGPSTRCSSPEPYFPLPLKKSAPKLFNSTRFYVALILCGCYVVLSMTNYDLPMAIVCISLDSNNSSHMEVNNQTSYEFWKLYKSK